MPTSYVIKWHPQTFLAQIDEIAGKEVDKAAAKIVDEARPPLDTGFLTSSGYVNSSTGFSTFDNRLRNGSYVSRHSGALVERSGANTPEPPPSKGAVAAWAADYSLDIEQRTSFIYQAVLKVAADK